MRTKGVRAWVQVTFLTGACVALAGAYLASGPVVGATAASPTAPFRLAQTTLPQAPETPVSPANPSAFPGTTPPGTNGVNGTNSLTGAPCIGTGGSAINGATPGATPPPPNGVYGQNSANPGAC
jgi:hypothetical protein